MKIELKDVHFSYNEKDSIVLKGISLEIASGEKLAIIGQNGSGKTTLARHLNGLLQPQRGEVWVGDWLVSAHTPASLARRVAYVFQNPDEQLFARKVWDEVAFGPRNLGYSRSQVIELTAHALAQTELTGVADENPRDLGLSMRRRVTLACALALQSPILVLDEPTSGMDERELTMFAGLLQHLHHSGKTLIVITHDLDFIAENIPRVIVLEGGKITNDSPTGAIFANHNLDEFQLPQIPRLGRRLGLKHTHLTPESLVSEL